VTNRLNLRLLLWFTRVADAGGIQRAARQYGMEESFFLERLSALEHELGVALFMSDGDRLLPTEAGARLHEHAIDLLSRVRTAGEQVQRIAHNPAEMAILGVPPSIALSITSRVAREFRTALPDAKLRIIEGMSGYLREWLATGRIDVAILYESPNISGETLTREALHIIGTRELLGTCDAFPFRNLGSVPVILPGPFHGLRNLVNRHAEQHNLKLDVVMEANSLNLMLDLAAQGAGCTILPVNVLDTRNPAYSGLRGVPLVSPSIYRGVTLSTSTNKPVSPAIKGLLQLVRNEIRKR